jgi:peptidyl-prolyl cis-trans isomerase A (cyclophilin A)
MTKRTTILFLLLGLIPLQATAEDHVCFDTTLGDICLRMLPDAAPNTVSNFLRYVDREDYNGTLVHRNVPGFVIQGGGFSGLPENFAQSIPTDASIALEAKRSNLRGTVAMARTSAPDSATNQWFINVVNNTALDAGVGGSGYAVFAEVVRGMDVVDRINALRVDNFANALQNTAFAEMPNLMAAGTFTAAFSDFIVVKQATRLKIKPYQCSASSLGDTLTEYCGRSVRMPVSVNGVLYEGTMDFIPGRGGFLDFVVDMNRLRLLPDTGQARATYANNALIIPSVRVGSIVYDNVRLEVIKGTPLELRVTGFTQR